MKIKYRKHHLLSNKHTPSLYSIRSLQLYHPEQAVHQVTSLLSENSEKEALSF